MGALPAPIVPSWRGPRIRRSCSGPWRQCGPPSAWCSPDSTATALTGALPPIPERHAVVRLPFIPDIRPLYDLVEMALHPSRWDALPQAVLEAMALGKPVIASRATGNAVIIRDGEDGLLVEPMDSSAWAAAIERLLGDPALAARLGVAARVRAREDFPFERTIDRNLALFRTLVHGGAPK